MNKIRPRAKFRSPGIDRDVAHRKTYHMTSSTAIVQTLVCLPYFYPYSTSSNQCIINWWNQCERNHDIHYRSGWHIPCDFLWAIFPSMLGVKTWRLNISHYFLEIYYLEPPELNSVTSGTDSPCLVVHWTNFSPEL